MNLIGLLSFLLIIHVSRQTSKHRIRLKHHKKPTYEVPKNARFIIPHHQSEGEVKINDGFTPEAITILKKSGSIKDTELPGAFGSDEGLKDVFDDTASGSGTSGGKTGTSRVEAVGGGGGVDGGTGGGGGGGGGGNGDGGGGYGGGAGGAGGEGEGSSAFTGGGEGREKSGETTTNTDEGSASHEVHVEISKPISFKPPQHHDAVAESTGANYGSNVLLIPGTNPTLAFIAHDRNHNTMEGSDATPTVSKSKHKKMKKHRKLKTKHIIVTNSTSMSLSPFKMLTTPHILTSTTSPKETYDTKVSSTKSITETAQEITKLTAKLNRKPTNSDATDNTSLSIDISNNDRMQQKIDDVKKEDEIEENIENDDTKEENQNFIKGKIDDNHFLTHKSYSTTKKVFGKYDGDGSDDDVDIKEIKNKKFRNQTFLNYTNSSHQNESSYNSLKHFLTTTSKYQPLNPTPRHRRLHNKHPSYKSDTLIQHPSYKSEHRSDTDLYQTIQNIQKQIKQVEQQAYIEHEKTNKTEDRREKKLRTKVDSVMKKIEQDLNKYRDSVKSTKTFGDSTFGSNISYGNNRVDNNVFYRENISIGYNNTAEGSKLSEDKNPYGGKSLYGNNTVNSIKYNVDKNNGDRYNRDKYNVDKYNGDKYNGDKYNVDKEEAELEAAYEDYVNETDQQKKKLKSHFIYSKIRGESSDANMLPSELLQSTAADFPNGLAGGPEGFECPWPCLWTCHSYCPKECCNNPYRCKPICREFCTPYCSDKCCAPGSRRLPKLKLEFKTIAETGYDLEKLKKEKTEIENKIQVIAKAQQYASQLLGLPATCPLFCNRVCAPGLCKSDCCRRRPETNLMAMLDPITKKLAQDNNPIVTAPVPVTNNYQQLAAKSISAAVDSKPASLTPHYVLDEVHLVKSNSPPVGQMKTFNVLDVPYLANKHQIVNSLLYSDPHSQINVIAQNPRAQPLLAVPPRTQPLPFAQKPSQAQYLQKTYQNNKARKEQELLKKALEENLPQNDVTSIAQSDATNLALSTYAAKKVRMPARLSPYPFPPQFNTYAIPNEHRSLPSADESVSYSPPQTVNIPSEPFATSPAHYEDTTPDYCPPICRTSCIEQCPNECCPNGAQNASQRSSID